MSNNKMTILRKKVPNFALDRAGLLGLNKLPLPLIVLGYYG
jgi:hypothetical protein